MGMILGYLLRKLIAARQVAGAEAKAEKLLADAKTKQQEMVLAAKDKALKIIEDAKHEEAARRRELTENQRRLEKRESLFDQKLLEFQDKQLKLQEKNTALDALKTEIQKLKDEEFKKLEVIAGLPRKEAEERLLKIVEEQAKDALAARLRKLESEGSEEFETKAKTILGTVVQRLSSSHSVETTTTSVDLPNDEMKGRIIGKEGRNIKAIEQLTGTEIIVDETPQVITVSGFSPIRRQIAKRALDKLIVDGRIHPARIEETVEESKRELAKDIKKAGEDALFSMGITGIDPKLTQILGRLKYRTSYGQNVLQHSLEVGHLSALLAGELGANIAIAKKGGLFHDIGKAVDHDVPGGHPEIGQNIMIKFGFPEEVAYMSIAHHEDKPHSLEGIIVKAADAISGARPGARKDTLEQYVQRLEELEKTATSFAGVEKAYAIQAGREVRVFVSPKAVDDFTAYRLAGDIAKKIESELRYPGEIRVTVIRETRVVEYAR